VGTAAACVGDMETGAIVVGSLVRTVGDKVAIKEGTLVFGRLVFGARVNGEGVGEVTGTAVGFVGVIVDGATVATVGRRVFGEEVGELTETAVGAIVSGTTGLSVGLKVVGT
jgi:hypothetical protein